MVLHGSEGKGGRGKIRSGELPAMHPFCLPLLVQLLCNHSFAAEEGPGTLYSYNLGCNLHVFWSQCWRGKVRFPGEGWRKTNALLTGIHHSPSVRGRKACLGKGLWARLGWQNRGKQWDFEWVVNFFQVTKKCHIFCLQIGLICLVLTRLIAVILPCTPQGLPAS